MQNKKITAFDEEDAETTKGNKLFVVRLMYRRECLKTYTLQGLARETALVDESAR